MFLIGGKIHIDDDGLAEAMKDVNPHHVYFLDVQNGQVGCKEKSDVHANPLDPTRYFQVPTVSIPAQAQCMLKFVKAILVREHPLLARKILAALSKKKSEQAFGDSVIMLTRDTEGWIHAWNEWEGDALWEEMQSWFSSLPVTIESKFEGCNDCALCIRAESDPYSAEDFANAAEVIDGHKSEVALSPELITERAIDDYYYDAMEYLSGEDPDCPKAERLLLEALKLDEHNVQTHVGLANVYGVSGDKKKAKKHILRAYEETVRIFPKLPRTMEWGVFENRRYMRAIHWQAEQFYENGREEEGIALMRKLLSMNPNDNQGIRYILAGIYAGIPQEKVSHMFDEGNRKQNWDALEKLVAEQNKKHRFWKEPQSK